MRLLPWGLALVGVLVYFNTLPNGFVFDDKLFIGDKLAVHNLSEFLGQLVHGTRPVVQLTLLANYAISGLQPAGYHIFNIAVHVLAGLALYGLVHRVQLATRRPDPSGRAAPWLAGTVALLWLVHPLNTQAVAYTIQRAESMTGLFFLVTMYGLVRYAVTPERKAWAVLAVAACTLGMGTKPVMAGAPVVALLLDRAFLSGSFKQALQQRWKFYLALVATWVMLIWVRVDHQMLAGMLSAPRSGGAASAQAAAGAGAPGGAGMGAGAAESLGPSAGFSLKLISWYAYLLSQGEVILHYLRLAVWPHPLVLDYQVAWEPAFQAWELGRASVATWLVPDLIVAAIGVAGLVAVAPTGGGACWWHGFLLCWRRVRALCPSRIM